jgi:hypothetical protein
MRCSQAAIDLPDKAVPAIQMEIFEPNRTLRSSKNLVHLPKVGLKKFFLIQVGFLVWEDQPVD